MPYTLSLIHILGTIINIYVYDLKTQTLTEPFKVMNLGGSEGCTGYYIDKDNHLWLGLTERCV